MRTFLHSALALTLFFSAHSSSAAELTPKAIYQSSIKSIVLIVGLDKNGTPLALGTGFYFRDNLVATNEHVVSGASSIVIKNLGTGANFNATRVRSYSKKLDVALIEVPTKAQPLPVGSKGSVSIGDKVIAIGNPRGLQGSLSTGIVSGVRKDGSQTVLQITAPISPGSSGGPVFDLSGKVIGLATFTLQESQNLNFAMPSSLLTILEAKRNGWEPLGVTPTVKKQGNAGIEMVLFKKTFSEFYESISLRNTTNNTIENLSVVIIYKTLKDVPFDYRTITLKDQIPPKMAKMHTSRSFDQQQNFVYEADQNPMLLTGRSTPFRVEVRVLSYDIASDAAGDVIDSILNNR